jgi:uncharacterized protein YxjI
MRYQIKEKLLCLGDDFRIKDENGRDVFLVDGKAFTLLREKLSFQDMEGRELAFIRERVLSLRKSYEIHRDGQLAAVVKKDLFNFLRCHFTVDVPGPDDLEATGSFLDREYTFKRGGRKVASVSRKWFSLTDSYGVDIAEGEDDVLILASTVVIDQICHDGKEDH